MRRSIDQPPLTPVRPAPVNDLAVRGEVLADGCQGRGVLPGKRALDKAQASSSSPGAEVSQRVPVWAALPRMRPRLIADRRVRHERLRLDERHPERLVQEVDEVEAAQLLRLREGQAVSANTAESSRPRRDTAEIGARAMKGVHRGSKVHRDRGEVMQVRVDVSRLPAQVVHRAEVDAGELRDDALQNPDHVVLMVIQGSNRGEVPRGARSPAAGLEVEHRDDQGNRQLNGKRGGGPAVPTSPRLPPLLEHRVRVPGKRHRPQTGRLRSRSVCPK